MTTYLDDPELYWTDMSDATWQAQNTAWSPGWCATMTRNQEYLKRVLYGTGSFVGNVPHSHTGGEDSHAAGTTGHNILGASNPAGASMDPGGIYTEWTVSGFYDADGLNYAQGGMRGDYMFQALYYPDNAIQYVPRLLGNGADMTLSFFARIRSSTSYGLLEAGISGSREGGGTGTDSANNSIIINSPGELIPGQRAIISGSDLSTSWKRFFFIVPNAASGLFDAPRFLIRVKETFVHEILIAGCMATQGRRLYPWAPSPCDQPWTGSASEYVGGHAGWQNMPADVPLLDWTVSMTNAVQLEPF